MPYFSAATCGFYVDGINAAIPVDARPITDEQHIELLNAQAEGATIAADANGDPVAVPRAPLTDEQLLEALRAERNTLLAASDWSQFPDAPLTDDQRAAWRIYRQTLRDLPETTSDLAAIEWPVPPTERL
ncbi:MAG: phage tail assembly chaperone [Novosphingobium sp.]|nr:phage tail assembly chaperone [Novosphingobium sp.]